MVNLYVGGLKVGTLAEVEKLIPEFMTRNSTVELREESGEVMGMFIPKRPLNLDSTDPLIPWDPTITEADIERIKAEPGFEFDEVRKQLGWT
ncbi:MAG TPA: hypothetical protein VGL71_04900 [Urbifossiella sp.]